MSFTYDKKFRKTNFFFLYGLLKIHEDWPILVILNSTVSVDTFFVLSGMLVGYNLLKLLDKSKGKLNVPMFYLHRYLRHVLILTFMFLVFSKKKIN